MSSIFSILVSVLFFYRIDSKFFLTLSGTPLNVNNNISLIPFIFFCECNQLNSKNRNDIAQCTSISPLHLCLKSKKKNIISRQPSRLLIIILYYIIYSSYNIYKSYKYISKLYIYQNTRFSLTFFSVYVPGKWRLV